jgi:hypothetical protein
LVLYAILVWLIFAKLKLVRWGWLSGTVTALVGVAIVSVFMALFNSLAPSGRMSPHAGVIGVIASVLLWVNTYLAYL